MFVEKTIVLKDGKLARIQYIESPTADLRYVMLPFRLVVWYGRIHGRFKIGLYRT